MTRFPFIVSNFSIKRFGNIDIDINELENHENSDCCI